jgi:hypothetical protein
LVVAAYVALAIRFDRIEKRLRLPDASARSLRRSAAPCARAASHHGA